MRGWLNIVTKWQPIYFENITNNNDSYFDRLFYKLTQKLHFVNLMFKVSPFLIITLIYKNND